MILQVRVLARRTVSVTGCVEWCLPCKWWAHQQGLLMQAVDGVVSVYLFLCTELCKKETKYYKIARNIFLASLLIQGNFFMNLNCQTLNNFLSFTASYYYYLFSLFIIPRLLWVYSNGRQLRWVPKLVVSLGFIHGSGAWSWVAELIGQRNILSREACRPTRFLRSLLVIPLKPWLMLHSYPETLSKVCYRGLGSNYFSCRVSVSTFFKEPAHGLAAFGLHVTVCWSSLSSLDCEKEQN